MTDSMKKLFLICCLFWAAFLSSNVSAVEFTPEERTYLQQHPVLTVGYSTAFEPLLMQDPAGKVIGIIPDVYQLISQKTGLKFSYQLQDWSMTLEALKQGNIDIIPSMAKALAQEKGFALNKSFSKATFSVFVRAGGPKIQSLNDLAGLKVGFNETRFRIISAIEKGEPVSCLSNSIFFGSSSKYG